MIIKIIIFWINALGVEIYLVSMSKTLQVQQVESDTIVFVTNENTFHMNEECHYIQNKDADEMTVNQARGERSPCSSCCDTDREIFEKPTLTANCFEAMESNSFEFTTVEELITQAEEQVIENTDDSVKNLEFTLTRIDVGWGDVRVRYECSDETTNIKTGKGWYSTTHGDVYHKDGLCKEASNPHFMSINHCRSSRKPCKSCFNQTVSEEVYEDLTVDDVYYDDDGVPHLKLTVVDEMVDEKVNVLFASPHFPEEEFVEKVKSKLAGARVEYILQGGVARYNMEINWDDAETTSDGRVAVPQSSQKLYYNRVKPEDSDI